MVQAAARSSVLVVDDHPLFRAGMRTALTATGLAADVHEADSIASALAALSRRDIAFDLVLYDWYLLDRREGGVKGFVAVAQAAERTPVLVVSASDDHDIRKLALDAGAAEFLCKTADPAQVHAVLRRWLARGTDGDRSPQRSAESPDKASPDAPQQRAPQQRAPQLTPRQLEVLRLLATGRSNKLIADAMQLAITTVRDHVSDILRLLNAKTRTEAAHIARWRGLI